MASEINLMAASNQWANRPADERFENLDSLLAAAKAQRAQAAAATVPANRLRLEPIGGDLRLVGPTGAGSAVTNWAFGQVSRLAGAPASYLQTLPADLAAQNVNHGLGRLDGDSQARLFFAARGNELTARSVTSDQYGRIFNADVVERLQNWLPAGWQVPPARPVYDGQPGTRPATAADVTRLGQGSSLSIKIGDPIAPAGLYMGDRDLFIFMVNEELTIDDGTDGGLGRGFFIQNSEVGAGALSITSFLYRMVCGNHIVWGAKAVRSLRIVHRKGNAINFDRRFAGDLRAYAGASAASEENRIRQAKACRLGDTRDQVIDVIYGKRLLTQKAANAAYDLAVSEAESHGHSDPKTAWGLAQGVTRLSQFEQFAGSRTDLDRAAGKILDLAF